ncbi:AMP-binding protein [Egibacter rhizosphaerae]|uniref:AMP-binding protein n=1 Tax=Egibacter rhizosphaerae TaxID=1670831 RepID=UPI0013F14748|nr:AMP-binding protein [Egibacter rhizosphaerae]
MPFTRLLDDAAHDFPSHEAVAFRGHTLTYRELLDQVDRCAAGLADLGITQGDRLASLLSPSPQVVIVTLAAARLGAVLVPLPFDISPEPIAHAVTDTGCRALVCEDRAYATVAQLKGRLPTLVHLLVTSPVAYAAFPRTLRGRLPRQARRDGAVGLKELIRRSPPAARQAPVDPAGDLLAVVGTWGAGTTADRVPVSAWDRGVALTHDAAVVASFQARLWIPDVQAGRERVLLAADPWSGFWLSGGLGLSLLSAARMGFPSAEATRIDRDVGDQQATLAVGGVARLAGDRGDHDPPAADAGLGGRAELTSLRVALVDGPVAPAAVERAHSRGGVRLRGGLALPELAGLAIADPVYGRARAGSYGLPLPDVAARVVDEDERPAADGATGRLEVAGPQLLRGYWGRPEQTRAVLRDGWLRTGRWAVRDAEGFLWPAPPPATA